MDINLDHAWSQFMLDQSDTKPVIHVKREHTETPICDPISISTKTKIMCLGFKPRATE